MLRNHSSTKLESGEHIMLSIARAKIGLVLIWAGEFFGFIILTLILILFLNGATSSSFIKITSAAQTYLYAIVFILYGVLFLTGIVGTKIYTSNHLYVTNKRVIQKTCTSLFNKSTNIIDLASIEDVSFKQSGIFEYIFKLGTIRLSTVGDETTYTFKYVDTPTDELEVILHLVHTAKSPSHTHHTTKSADETNPSSPKEPTAESQPADKNASSKTKSQKS